MNCYTEEERSEIIPHNTLYDQIFIRNKNRLDKNSLLYFGNRISYRKLFRETDRIVNALVHMGVKKGDVINLLVAATPEAVYMVLACSKLGALANFLNPLFNEQQIIDRINDTESPYLFVLDKMIPLVEKVVNRTCIEKIVCIPVAESMPKLVKMIASKKTDSIEGGMGWNDFVMLGKEGTFTPQDYIEDTPVVMVYSSGTTGASKGIVLTNDSILATCIMEKTSLTALIEATFLAIIPIWFSTGISLSILVPLANGGTVILEPQYSETNFTKDIVKWKPEGIVGTASLWESAISDIKSKNLSHIKCAISGGEPISPDFEKRLNAFLKERKCECTLVKGYGQCELGGTVTLSKGIDKEASGDVGIPLSQVVVSTFDMDSGKELKFGEIGEIRVLSPARMKGYYNRPEETEKKFYRDPSSGRIWVCTGDAGMIRNDGHVVVLGRISDSYISSTGKRHFFFHIKNTILENCFVNRCEVVKIVDQENDLIVAHIVLQKDVNVDEAITSIQKWCAERLDKEETPNAYKVRTSFALNPTSGKVDTEALKADTENLIVIHQFS